MPATAHVFDATEQNFETDVIQASLTTPVLVDFWAPGAAMQDAHSDSRKSRRRLRRQGQAGQGRHRRANATRSRVRIRSLPTVVLVKDGQMVDGFMGALPESGVREFLQRHLGAVETEEEERSPPMTRQRPRRPSRRLHACSRRLRRPRTRPN